MTTEATSEAFSEQPKNLLRMNSSMKGACGFVGWNHSSLYIELYDHSEAAYNAFGNDFATIYRVDADQLSVFIEKMFESWGQRVEQGALPEILSSQFFTIEDLIRWLESTDIPYNKTFDSWA